MENFAAPTGIPCLLWKSHYSAHMSHCAGIIFQLVLHYIFLVTASPEVKENYAGTGLQAVVMCSVPTSYHKLDERRYLVLLQQTLSYIQGLPTVGGIGNR